MDNLLQLDAILVDLLKELPDLLGPKSPGGGA